MLNWHAWEGGHVKVSFSNSASEMISDVYLAKVPYLDRGYSDTSCMMHTTYPRSTSATGMDAMLRSIPEASRTWYVTPRAAAFWATFYDSVIICGDIS